LMSTRPAPPTSPRPPPWLLQGDHHRHARVHAAAPAAHRQPRVQAAGGDAGALIIDHVRKAAALFACLPWCAKPTGDYLLHHVHNYSLLRPSSHTPKTRANTHTLSHMHTPSQEINLVQSTLRLYEALLQPLINPPEPPAPGMPPPTKKPIVVMDAQVDGAPIGGWVGLDPNPEPAARAWWCNARGGWVRTCSLPHVHTHTRTHAHTPCMHTHTPYTHTHAHMRHTCRPQSSAAW